MQTRVQHGEAHQARSQALGHHDGCQPESPLQQQIRVVQRAGKVRRVEAQHFVLRMLQQPLGGPYRSNQRFLEQSIRYRRVPVGGSYADVIYHLSTVLVLRHRPAYVTPGPHLTMVNRSVGSCGTTVTCRLRADL